MYYKNHLAAFICPFIIMFFLSTCSEMGFKVSFNTSGPSLLSADIQSDISELSDSYKIKFDTGLIQKDNSANLADIVAFTVNNKEIDNIEANIFNPDKCFIEITNLPILYRGDAVKIKIQKHTGFTDIYGNYVPASQIEKTVTPYPVPVNNTRLLTVITFAGAGQTSNGAMDGFRGNARFNNPFGITLDDDDNLYVADSNNHAIRKITPEGEVSTIAGTLDVSGSDDGTGLNARFNNPKGIYYFNETLYVADTGNKTIRQMTKGTNGWQVKTIAGDANEQNPSPTDGDGITTARFKKPFGIVASNNNNANDLVLYVTDSSANRIRTLTPPINAQTEWQVGTIMVITSTDSTSTNSEASFFNIPSGITVDSSGNLYLADTQYHVIRKLTHSNGDYWNQKVIAGTEGSAGYSSGAPTFFDKPKGLAIDTHGNLYVSEKGGDSSGNAGHTISALSFDRTQNSWEESLKVGEPGSQGLVNGVFYTSDYNIYTSDYNIPLEFASPQNQTNPQNQYANPLFDTPQGIAVSPDGKIIYIADTKNNCIRKIIREFYVQSPS